MVSPLTSTLAFALFGQLLPALVFVPLHTEKFYDLCGSLGFLSTTAMSLYLTPLHTADTGAAKAATGLLPVIKSGLSRLLLSAQQGTSLDGSTASGPLLLDRHARQWIASACVAVWAVRLGSFLFARIHKSGRDPRFDTIKHNAQKFTFAWAMQAVWVGLTALPVYMINALPSRLHAPLGILDVLALGVWAAGWTLEIVADRTKSQWRTEREQGKHKEAFLSRGVWGWSRHPNYFGEITLWTGLALLASSTLAQPAAVAYFGTSAMYAPILAPTFEYALIRFLSGVPMLEEAQDKKLKSDPKYEQYKANVPCFVPFVGSLN